MVERQNRSSKYQHLILEASCSNDMMESFSNEDSIMGRLTGGFLYSEELLELEDQLKKEFWRIVNSELTERQKQVITLSAEGLTQMEIAKKVGVNQSSITKSLNGNSTYNIMKNSETSPKTSSKTNKKDKKNYGGIIKKLNKIIDSDPIILEILKKINTIREERW